MVQDEAPLDPLTQSALDLDPANALITGGALVILGIGAVALFSRWALRGLPPAGELSPRPTWRWVLEVFGIWMLAAWAGTHLYPRLVPADHPLLSEPMVKGLTIQMGANAVALLHLLICLKLAGGRLPDLGLSWRRFGAFVAMGVGFYLAIIPAHVGASYLEIGIRGATGLDQDFQQVVTDLLAKERLRSNLWLLGTVALAVPLLEEIFFRGLLLTVLVRRLPISAALVVNALLFALMHDAGRLSVFVLGLSLAYLYVRTRSLVAPIALHVMHNSLVLCVLLFGPESAS